MNNPDEASPRGLWSDPAFLDNVADLNPQLKHTQFADFHGHGWVFRAVFKKDRQGNLLDHNGRVLANVGTAQLMAAVKVPAAIQAQRKGGRLAPRDEGTVSRSETTTIASRSPTSIATACRCI